MLREDVSDYQAIVERGINKMLDYYGFTEVRAKLKEARSSLYLSIMEDIAKEVMTINERRTQILGLLELEDLDLGEQITGSQKPITKQETTK
jgi:hypothetical protein